MTGIGAGRFVERLRRVGFRPDEARRRADLFERVAAACGAGGDRAWRFDHVPGRIEVLGKHTDYAGGRSLVCATEQGFAVAIGARDDRWIGIEDVARGERREFPIRPDLEPPRGEWINYPMTVAARLARDFGSELRGVDLVLASDLPIAAGVSSSSALVVAVARALIDRNQLAATPAFRREFATAEALAGYFGAVENGRPFRGFGAATGVGTMGGSQDQTAILCSRPDALSQFRFDPVRFEQAVAWPESLEFVIASSGVVAEKTGAALEHYNALARETALLRDFLVEPGDAATTLGRAIIDPADPGPALAAARGRIGAHPDGALRARLEARLVQLVAECRTIIPGVAAALGRGDLGVVGTLVAASQAGAEVGLRNQVPETAALVGSALRLGARAASAFGAGFGGSVWAMIPADRAESFAAGWEADYRGAFPDQLEARFFRTRPALPATRVD